MMELWEYRYKHILDVRNSQIAARNEAFGEKIEIPKERHGTIHDIKGLWMRFSGTPFWKRLEALGHSSTIYEECKCKATP